MTGPTREAVHRDFAALVELGHALGIDDPLFMVPDVGASSYDFNTRIIMDGAGLTDTTFAREQSVDSVSKYIFDERQPDIVRAHGKWIPPHHLNALQWTNHGYLVGTPLPYGFAGGDNAMMYVRKAAFVNQRTNEKPLATTTTGIALDRFVTPSSALPGKNVPVDLFVSTVRSPNTASQYQIEVVRDDGRSIQISSGTLGYGYYPSTTWKPGEQIRQRIYLKAMPAGQFTVRITIDGQLIETARITRDAVSSSALAQESHATALYEIDQKRYVQAKQSLDQARYAVDQDDLVIRKRLQTSWRDFLLSEIHRNGHTASKETLIELHRVRGRAAPSSDEKRLANAWAADALRSLDAGDQQSAYLQLRGATLLDPHNAGHLLELNKIRRRV